MKDLFPDTNSFLEFRKAVDLPWHELDNAAPGQGRDIRLIIPSTVITEIERHKTKGNSRTAKRARDVSATLRKALVSHGHVTELRASGPRIVLELPPVVNIDFSQFPNLDPTRPDHRIAAEYAEVLKQRPGLIVVTDDTLLTLAVRSLGFEPILIPESWRLEPEKDERDDEIDRLRDENKSLKQSRPRISITAFHLDDNPINSLVAKTEVFDPSEQEVEQAMTLIQRRFPIATDFGSSPPVSRGYFGEAWRAPKAGEIDDYKNRGYPRWRDSVRKALPILAERLNALSHEVPFSIRLSNDGFVNATDLRLTITGFDGIMVQDALSDRDKTEREKSLLLPSAPAPPRGGYISVVPAYAQIVPPDMPSIVRDYMRPLAAPPRDPNGFYFVDGRPKTPVAEIEMTCEAFPHQSDPYELAFRAVILREEVGQQPRLRIRARARNLPKPIEKYVSVAIEVERGDFVGWVSTAEYED